MDEIAHRNLMQLSETSRVATADASDLGPEPSRDDDDQNHALPLSDMLGMGLEALLNQFRRK
jgi:hypothetical protein